MKCIIHSELLHNDLLQGKINSHKDFKDKHNSKKYAENSHIVYLFKVVMLWITDVPAKTLVTLLSSPSSAFSFTNKILRRLDSLKENLKKK